MNLLTTCVLSGALATSFLARPSDPAPGAPTTPTATTATAATGQDAPKKYEDPTWSRVTRVAFFPGKRGAAIDIIQDHFRPATVASGGTQPTLYRHATGRFDLTAVWTLPEGTASLDWEISPESIAWRDALTEQLGSVEEAEALIETYRSYVREAESDLVRTLELKPARPVEASSPR